MAGDGRTYDLSDYIITRDGQVINIHNNHVVKPQKNDKGYYRVSIGGKLQFVHRLVATLYVPNPENKPQVNHIDGNKENNHAENLEWVTNQENRNHAMKHGLHLTGEKCSWSKLSRKDVEFIRENYNLGKSFLAQKYNVTPKAIYEVAKRITWKD